jgi:hypothetical protein
MKRLLFLTLLILSAITIKAQTNKVDKLQALEQNQTSGQTAAPTATLKNSSRLFASKDDLTTVILIIPADSVVTVLDSDSTYLHVVFEDNEGYIFNRHVVLNQAKTNTPRNVQTQQVVQETQPVQEQNESRYSYLENKYGSNMAARLIAGKIWKGMSSEMAKDSWGVAEKINRVINGNVVKEEWIFRNTWLFFENNTLVECGPRKN